MYHIEGMVTSATRSRPRTDRRTRAARNEGRDGRAELLKAASRVFAEKGFRAASVEEIAAKAGFSKGAVYWHFESKDDLFFALLDERLDRPLHQAIEQFESAPAETDMSLRADDVFALLVEQHRDLVLLEHEYWSLAVRDPRLRARYVKRQAAFRKAYARAIEARLEHRGEPPPDVPAEEIATALIGAIQGMALEKLVDPDAVPAHLPSELHALVYAGVVARARAAAEAGE
jgi:AcrR family transcriptional regulator